MVVKLANNHKFISFNLPILKFSCKYSQHLISSASIKKYFKPIAKALDTLFKELPDPNRDFEQDYAAIRNYDSQ